MNKKDGEELQSLLDSIQSVSSSLADFRKTFELKANALKIHYDCMREAGFNDNQAMFLTNEFSISIENGSPTKDK